MPNPLIWLAERYGETLQNAGLTGFDEVMASTSGRCLRVLSDRENWICQGMYLKKHRAQTWATRIAAALGPGIFAQPRPRRGPDALALQSQGIDVMP